MSECSTSVNTEARDPDKQNTPPACGNLSEKAEIRTSQHANDQSGSKQRDLNCLRDVDEEEEEDDEDVDFNPLLKETHSVEASSSLSSDVEDLDTDVAESGGNPSGSLVENPKETPGDTVKDGHPNGDLEHGEEILMQTRGSSEELCQKNSDTTYAAVTGGSTLITQSENLLLCDKENESTALTDVSNGESSRKSIVDVDAEGAIWMRTRARYSLTSFTLDELETFLQETDDEDDLQNVDDEAEYRKFLAAVLQGDNCDTLQGNANAEDEDEENDADFELELEEALESDPDEIEKPRMSRRNRRQKASLCCSKKPSEQLSRPLRPVLPFVPVGSFSAYDENKILPNFAPSTSFPANNGFTFGFTPHQIGQLHCLIHEHVQLLIQIFSVGVLDPAKCHIASAVKELILEMLKVRDQVLTCRTVPYPSFCFLPPHVHSSLPDEPQNILPLHDNYKNMQGGFSSGSLREPLSNILSMSNGTDKCLADGNAGSSQNQECTSWMPYICGPVLSVTDVAPLRLAGQYIDDVASVVQRHKRRQIEVGHENLSEKEPLFPLHISCSADSDGQGEIENSPQASNGMLSSSSNNNLPKKTMAATLVEKAKRQSVALVPKEIAKLAQRFWPLFNPALYPHKPPPAPIANRVLFTEAEDELLALGLMEYNTDWKAIQQRFLPCKSKHQIFVRQKNRASSKAPENPIKAVRRMKNSPLTPEEIAHIEAGLKKFKLDWISIWRFLVPYRDPSLLPRQWRIACGTQKSYKADAHQKAKRRLYEARNKATRHFSSALDFSSGKELDDVDNSIGETKGRDDCIDKQDEAYVHEAFLADWRPDNNVSSSCPPSLPSQVGLKSREQQKENSGVGASSSLATSRSFNSQIALRPYRSRRPNAARMVKLAPDLPPVNLPPSVRVMSQSAFRNCQPDVSPKVPVNTFRIGGMMVENGAKKLGSASTSEVNHSVKCGHRTDSSKITANLEPSKHFEVLTDKSVAEERDNSDLHMHPLFFQTLQDGRLPYFPPNTSSSSTFFKKQPQLNLSLFHNPRHIKDAMNYLSKSSKPSENYSSDVDFHPLLHSTNPIAADQKCDSIEHTSCAAGNKPLGDSSRVSGERIGNFGGKINGLYLDINLNVTSNDKSGTNNKTLSCTGHKVNALSESIRSEGANDSGKDKDLALHEIGDKPDARDLPQDGFGNNGNAIVTDNIHNESLSEIVMEQEELSDSDEELGENVEFEHEEMADSGEDTSDPEQVVDIPDEELQVEEFDADVGSQNLQSSLGCGGNLYAPLDGNGVNAKHNARSFNLNSHPPVSPLSNPKNASYTFDFGPFGKFDQGQHHVSAKRPARRKRVDDAPDRPKVGSGDTSMGKQRKRGRISTLNSGIAGSVKVDLSSDMDLNVDSSKKNVETD